MYKEGKDIGFFLLIMPTHREIFSLCLILLFTGENLSPVYPCRAVENVP